MGSVATSDGSGTATLIQLLSGTGSALSSSGLSSSQLQSALKGASPSDIVQLSDQALQLQVADGLFGSPEASQTAGLYSAGALFSAPSPTSSSATLDGILATLSGAASSTTPVSDQFATYQSELQAEQVQSLFAADSTAGVSGTSLDVFM